LRLPDQVELLRTNATLEQQRPVENGATEIRFFPPVKRDKNGEVDSMEPVEFDLEDLKIAEGVTDAS
jgi:hypothetical protein